MLWHQHFDQLAAILPVLAASSVVLLLSVMHLQALRVREHMHEHCIGVQTEGHESCLKVPVALKSVTELLVAEKHDMLRCQCMLQAVLSACKAQFQRLRGVSCMGHGHSHTCKCMTLKKWCRRKICC